MLENKLREIIISVTNKCNLRCTMCQIPYKRDDEMSTEELKALITDSKKLNPRRIVFSGGEPLLRKDIFELISFTDQHKINTCLTSNGTIIDNEIAKRLATAGVGVVNISIEGPQEVHDSLRGQGSFKKSIEALGHLSKCNIETTIATVVCRENYNSLPFVMELAHQFGVTTVKFQPFSEIFLVNKDIKRDFYISPLAIGEVKRSIKAAAELSKTYKITLNPNSYLDNIPGYLCGLWKRRSRNGCSAIHSSCPISAKGDVYLCWTLSDKVLGNARKSRLYDIWNSPEHQRQRQLISKKGCSGCLMSCYDYNLGNYGLRHTLYFKARKLRKARFYKRQYYRLYQYSIYILNKITNRIMDAVIPLGNDSQGIAGDLEEIQKAKNMLRKKQAMLEKHARS